MQGATVDLPLEFVLKGWESANPTLRLRTRGRVLEVTAGEIETAGAAAPTLPALRPVSRASPPPAQKAH